MILRHKYLPWGFLAVMVFLQDHVIDLLSSPSCNVTLIGSGKNDPDSNQWEASILLNGEYAFYRPYNFQTDTARGIHLGLLNVTSCQLMGTPQRFDTYDSSSHNQAIADLIDAFPLNNTDVMMVGVSGDNYGRKVDEVGTAALGELGLPELWLVNDRTSFVVLGRPGCEKAMSDYRASGQGPVTISAHFKVSPSPSNTACAVFCMNDEECSSFSQSSDYCTLFTVPGQAYNQTRSVLLSKVQSCKPTMWYYRQQE